jgi:hypothetical protein
MSSTEDIPKRRKRGRPPTGKKGYYVRMTPATKVALNKAAKVGGYGQLGDWLASLPLDLDAMERRIFFEMSDTERVIAFGSACQDALRSLSVLKELVDCNPPLGKAELKAFVSIGARFSKVEKFARHVGLKIGDITNSEVQG